MLSTKAIMSNIESEEHQCPEPSPFPLPQFAFPNAVLVLTVLHFFPTHWQSYALLLLFLGLLSCPCKHCSCICLLGSLWRGREKDIVQGCVIKFFCSQSSHLGEHYDELKQT